MNGVGISCHGSVARFAAVLVLCFSVFCAAFDPYSDIALVVSVDEVADLADTVSPTTPDPDGGQVRVAREQAPDLGFVGLCDDMLGSTRNWRFVCVFEARGPPA